VYVASDTGPRRSCPAAPAPQAVYRCHDAAVVLVAFLSDAATMLTVDQLGLVALWPASDADRSGGCDGHVFWAQDVLQPWANATVQRA
jgi:hypothetical protein